MCAFRVTSPKQISYKIIPHFYKYILITKKQADYRLFKEIIMLIIKGEHLKEIGLQSIINIRVSQRSSTTMLCGSTEFRTIRSFKNSFS